MTDHLPILSDDHLKQLQAQVDVLPALERQAFLLAASQRLTSEQVAERMQVSKRQAGKLIARALATLDARLNL
ncbi:hypothetical protein HJG53_14120 [Sphingomonas sp. ID1715]|uniref:sigma factor-like helix-turn-helix DNA-binding protein n=1 Tax=Sphingomonas sp. ID1715 TaxID=1656898 RepID=UPI001488CBBF|nr:sigma factor-like helix-turn-helix DNA-binding protein [Sphingomonas sp. ID1715]NNM78039.1 hypothetical protein [Sphingomonas sp. ID1715]